MAVQGVQQVDEALVRAYAEDLQALLEEADLTERKAFLRSFVKRIEIDKGQVIVNYTLPLPPDGRVTESVGVLPIVTFGGAGETRTRDLLTASQTLSL
jgi:site-specific DNA recombinase